MWFTSKFNEYFVSMDSRSSVSSFKSDVVECMFMWEHSLSKNVKRIWVPQLWTLTIEFDIEKINPRESDKIYGNSVGKIHYQQAEDAKEEIDFHEVGQSETYRFNGPRSSSCSNRMLHSSRSLPPCSLGQLCWSWTESFDWVWDFFYLSSQPEEIRTQIIR